jgi:hypothetical protein
MKADVQTAILALHKQIYDMQKEVDEVASFTAIHQPIK